MKIEKLDYFGRGVAHINDKVVFVKGALPLEDVEYKIIKEKKKIIEAECIGINKKSKVRVKPKCKYYEYCGGCSLMHISEDDQIEFKKNKVKDILKYNSGEDVNIENITYDKFYYYRNKIVLHVKDSKLGFYKNKTNELVEIDECLIANKKINELIKFLKKYLVDKNIEEIMIRVGNITEEVLLSINGDELEYNSILDKVDCLIINDKVVSKKGYIISIIGNKKYKVSKDSFFQINEVITEKIYNEVLNTIKKINSKNVLDLYCGTGTIGIYIADEVYKVTGVEVINSAIEDAMENARFNKIKNIEFICDKVENIIDKIISDNIDTVILDPPRAGIHNNVINSLLKIKPKNIIYISCNPLTLARDLKLIKKDYEIKKITVYDMFPNTYHVETVMILEKKDV